MSSPHYRNQWLEFYNSIREPSWPDCYNEHQFHSLPTWIQKEILEQFNGAAFLSITDSDVEFAGRASGDQTPELKVELRFPVNNNFDIYYTADLEGTGTTLGQDYPRVLRYLYPNRTFDHALDWCAGAGFIGFRLLNDGLCKSVTLTDVHAPAIEYCNKTIRHMPSHYRAQAVCASGVEQLSHTVKFDLVVGSPPQLSSRPDFVTHPYDTNTGYGANNDDRIHVDANWHIHQNFFANIGSRLADDGVIVLLHSVLGSSSDTFRTMLDQHGLVLGRCFRLRSAPLFWYMEVLHAPK